MDYLLKELDTKDTFEIDSQRLLKLAKIIYMEGRCDQMKDVVVSMRNANMPAVFDIRHLNLGKKLTSLTENRDPNLVFEPILKKPNK